MVALSSYVWKTAVIKLLDLILSTSSTLELSTLTIVVRRPTRAQGTAPICSLAEYLESPGLLIDGVEIRVPNLV
jgi:hypothetical protein